MKKLRFGIWISVFTLILVLSRPNPSHAWVREQDSLILVEFYNAANGDTWTNNDNWLVTPVIWWHGITLWNDTAVLYIELHNNNLNGFISPLLCQLPMLCVIDFSENNFSGQIPDCIGHLRYLSGLILNNNHFSGQLPESLGLCADSSGLTLFIENNEFEGDFPDTIINAYFLQSLSIIGNKFSYVRMKSSFIFFQFNMENNCFTFEDIIPYKLDPPVTFTYAPQDSVLTEIDTTLLVGSTLVMDAWVDTCSNNKYRWKKNGTYLNLAPSSNPQWVIPVLQYSDSGYYTCDITNNLAGQLVLKRRLIKVHVTTDVGDLEPKPKETLQVSHDPKEDLLHILMDFPVTVAVSCNLYDANGRKMMRCYEGNTQNQSFHYSLQSFPHGVYILRTLAGNKTYTHKIVK